MRYASEEPSRFLPGALGDAAPVIYVIDMVEHHFDVDEAAAGLACNVVELPVARWDDALTPWPAPGLYDGDPDFAGDAKVTLAEVLGAAIPHAEGRLGLSPARRAICGYSLGGLFSLYAFANTAAFDACGCLSGSVWYEGWMDYLEGLDLSHVAGRFAFFSIGSKERKAPQQILHCVQDNMAACERILASHGCETRYVVGPGTHFERHEERFRAGFCALDKWLAA